MSELAHHVHPIAVSSSRAPSEVWLRFGLAVVLYAGVFLFWQIQPVPWHVFAAAVVLAGICLIPLALWLQHGRQGAPVFEVVCLSFLIQYSSPAFLFPNHLIIYSRPVPVSWDDTFRTLVLASVAAAAMIFGFYFARNGRWASWVPSIDLPLDPSRRARYLSAAVVVGLGIAALQIMNLGPSGAGPLGAFMRLLANQFSVALVLLAYDAHQNPGSRFQIGLSFALAGVASVLGLASGLLEPVLIPFVLLFLVRWHSGNRFPWLLLIGAFVIFAALSPVKRDYRLIAWYGGESPGIAERVELWWQLSRERFSEVVSGDRERETRALADDSLGRFDLLHRSAFVMSRTPEAVPYYYGETYRYLLYGWIPRIIWPEKPVASDATARVDVDYGLLYSWQTATARVSIGQVAEAYANFGRLGVPFILFLQGICFGVLDRMLNGPRSEGGRAVYLSLAVFFLNGLGTAAVVFYGALFQHVVANCVIVRLAAGRIGRPRGIRTGRPVWVVQTGESEGEFRWAARPARPWGRG